MDIQSEGIVITRVLAAPIEKVWAAWTQPDLAQGWWGPQGFSAPSIKIDLHVGGKYIFAMHGPAGSEWDKDMYSAGEYLEILSPSENPRQAKMGVTDYFSDEQGNLLSPSEMGQDAAFPKESIVTVTFDALEDGKTKLTIFYPRPASEVEFAAMMKSGMIEGWNSSLDKLAEIVAQ